MEAETVGEERPSVDQRVVSRGSARPSSKRSAAPRRTTPHHTALSPPPPPTHTHAQCSPWSSSGLSPPAQCPPCCWWGARPAPRTASCTCAASGPAAANRGGMGGIVGNLVHACRRRRQGGCLSATRAAPLAGGGTSQTKNDLWSAAPRLPQPPQVTSRSAFEACKAPIPSGLRELADGRLCGARGLGFPARTLSLLRSTRVAGCCVYCITACGGRHGGRLAAGPRPPSVPTVPGLPPTNSPHLIVLVLGVDRVVWSSKRCCAKVPLACPLRPPGWPRPGSRHVCCAQARWELRGSRQQPWSVG